MYLQNMTNCMLIKDGVFKDILWCGEKKIPLNFEWKKLTNYYIPNECIKRKPAKTHPKILTLSVFLSLNFYIYQVCIVSYCF